MMKELPENEQKKKEEQIKRNINPQKFLFLEISSMCVIAIETHKQSTQ